MQMQVLIRWLIVVLHRDFWNAFALARGQGRSACMKYLLRIIGRITHAASQVSPFTGFRFALHA